MIDNKLMKYIYLKMKNKNSLIFLVEQNFNNFRN